MFQWKSTLKRSSVLVSAGVLLAAPAGTVEAKVCEENEYLAAYSTIGNGVSLFDSDGTYCASVDAYLDLYGFMRIPENTVLMQRRDSEWIPYSLPEMRELPAISAETCRVASFQNYYAVVDTDLQTFEVLDETGNIRYHMECEETELTDLYVGFLKLQEGFAAAMFQGEQWMGVLFDEEGNALREIESKDVCRSIAQSWGGGDGIGNDILVRDEDTVRLCDLDGKTILTGTNAWSPSAQEYSIQEYNGGQRDPAQWLVLTRGEDTYLVDQELRETQLGCQQDLECVGKFLKGQSYAELGDRVCSGFLTDGSGKKLPYAMEGGTAYVLTDNLLMPLLEMYFYEGEKPLRMNKDYVLTKRMLNEEEAEFTVYSISDWEPFYSYTSQEYDDSRIKLSEDRLAIIEELPSEEYGYYRVLMHDGEGNLTYEDQGHYLYLEAWKNNLWYIRRGVYEGLINGDGAWEFKLTNWAE